MRSRPTASGSRLPPRTFRTSKRVSRRCREAPAPEPRNAMCHRTGIPTVGASLPLASCVGAGLCVAMGCPAVCGCCSISAIFQRCRTRECFFRAMEEWAGRREWVGEPSRPYLLAKHYACLGFIQREMLLAVPPVGRAAAVCLHACSRSVATKYATTVCRG